MEIIMKSFHFIPVCKTVFYVDEHSVVSYSDYIVSLNMAISAIYQFYRKKAL
jgi:hypothetical protein